MPRYKNETASAIQWNGLSWGEGYEADSAIFCPPDVGLTKISDLPAVQGLVLLAEDKAIVSGTPTTIELPYPASGRLWISCMAVSGACALKLGDGDAAIFVMGMIVGAGFAHNFATASSPAGPGLWGPASVVAGLAVCLVIGFTMRQKA